MDTDSDVEFTNLDSACMQSTQLDSLDSLESYCDAGTFRVDHELARAVGELAFSSAGNAPRVFKRLRIYRSHLPIDLTI